MLTSIHAYSFPGETETSVESRRCNLLFMSYANSFPRVQMGALPSKDQGTSASLSRKDSTGQQTDESHKEKAAKFKQNWTFSILVSRENGKFWFILAEMFLKLSNDNEFSLEFVVQIKS